jgi:hypothetical protein
MLSARMTPEQEEFLNRRLREATSQQPELKRLRELLLDLGGEFLVAPPKLDQDSPNALGAGLPYVGSNYVERHGIKFMPSERAFGLDAQGVRNCRYCNGLCSQRR